VEYGFYQLFYSREVLIMSAKTACKLPDSLNRIKLWTIGRQEQQLQSMPIFSKPRSQQFCVVPASIVYNNNYLAAFTMSSEKTFQKLLKRVCIKRLSTFGNKGTISNANRPQYPDMLSGRSMQRDRILNVRMYPHGTPRTVLLEMTFILKPKVNVIFFC
jgi:hypothetical protein